MFKPVWVHGDLWSGNAAQLNSTPVVFDPAMYYGDRETDLAMMKLFGGFGDECFAAYEHEWPCLPGAADRVPLYQLYHVINHANIFGGHYLDQTRDRLRQLVHRSRDKF